MKFLKHYMHNGVPTKTDIAGVHHMAHWRTIHDYIRHLKAEPQSLTVLVHMMNHELMRTPGPRMDIMVRLHGRFSKLRWEVERVEIGRVNRH